MARTMSRRRAISILGAAAGLPLLGMMGAARAAASPVIWRGRALGAPATLILNHPDKTRTQALLSRVVAEVDRLEEIFSLYRPSSALCQLNRLGALPTPPAELVQVLEASEAARHMTGGAFDPTVQPLWALYARHFSNPGADPSGPALKDLQDMRGRIGFDAVRFNRDRIVFLRPGMALTLNGIAQGFITDAIVAMLRADGITSSLVDMGENRAIGAKEDGSPWQVGLAEAELDTVPDTVIDLVDKAVATTAGTGFHFDQRGGLSHILDPQQETATPRYRRLTTIANTATLADAVSTGFSLMTEPSLRTVIAKTPDLAVDLIRLDGSHIRIER